MVRHWNEQMEGDTDSHRNTGTESQRDREARVGDTDNGTARFLILFYYWGLLPLKRLTNIIHQFGHIETNNHNLSFSPKSKGFFYFTIVVKRPFGIVDALFQILVRWVTISEWPSFVSRHHLLYSKKLRECLSIFSAEGDATLYDCSNSSKTSVGEEMASFLV